MHNGCMRTERARLLPLAGQPAINRLGAEARQAPDTRPELLHERQLSALPEMKERAAREFEDFAELSNGVGAVRTRVLWLRARGLGCERRLAVRALQLHEALAIDSG